MTSEPYKWQRHLPDWEGGPAEFLWIEVLGGCGCGSSSDIATRAWLIFNDFSLPHAVRTINVYDTVDAEVLVHWMNREGLMEHGTSVGGGWLTEQGKALHAALSEMA